MLALIKTTAICFNKVSQEHKGAKMAPLLTEEGSACCLTFTFSFFLHRQTREKNRDNRILKKRGHAVNDLSAT